jgi:hypothetical protein
MLSTSTQIGLLGATLCNIKINYILYTETDNNVAVATHTDPTSVRFRSGSLYKATVK